MKSPDFEAFTTKNTRQLLMLSPPWLHVLYILAQIFSKYFHLALIWGHPILRLLQGRTRGGFSCYLPHDYIFYIILRKYFLNIIILRKYEVTRLNMKSPDFEAFTTKNTRRLLMLSPPWLHVLYNTKNTRLLDFRLCVVFVAEAWACAMLSLPWFDFLHALFVLLTTAWN